LIEEKDAEQDRQMRSGFGMCSIRLDDSKRSQNAHIGPTTYNPDRGGFEMNTFNIRYT
jgi:hypothetical protein